MSGGGPGTDLGVGLDIDDGFIIFDLSSPGSGGPTPEETSEGTSPPLSPNLIPTKPGSTSCFFASEDDSANHLFCYGHIDSLVHHQKQQYQRE